MCTLALDKGSTVPRARQRQIAAQRSKVSAQVRNCVLIGDLGDLSHWQSYYLVK